MLWPVFSIEGTVSTANRVLARMKMKRITLPIATNFHMSALVSYCAARALLLQSSSHTGVNMTNLSSLHRTVKVLKPLPKATQGQHMSEVRL